MKPTFVQKQLLKHSRNNMRTPFPLTFGEEVANSLSHGVMAVICLILLPIIAVYSYLKGGFVYCFGVSVYMICMLLMFLASCLYHSAPYRTTYKYVYRKIDHIMILLAIAGTYTPICLVLMEGIVPIVILSLEWVVVLIGILLKAISQQSHPKLSMVMYMSMGWLAVIILPELLRQANPVFLALIVGGGVMYSIGALFYRHPERNYFHFIWHLCICAASIMHGIAILFYLI